MSKNITITFESFFTALIATLLLIIVFLWNTEPEEPETYSLNKEQKEKIISQIKMEGLIIINRLGCNGPIAEYIQTGEWSDEYCYKAYGHLELK